MPLIDIWSMEEKRRLALLLEIYPLYAYRSIAKKMPTKNAEEVKAFIEKMKYSVEWHDKYKPRDPATANRRSVAEDSRAPLEEWLDMCSRFVEHDEFDMSIHLSKVMTVIASFEDFEVSDKHPPVNYSSIYRYLAQVLQGNRQDDLETLGPLEASVMLDVIHSLMDVLSGTDLTVHRNVMQWKCRLLDDRDEDGFTLPESMKKAAENDFAALIEEEDKNMNEKLAMLKARLEALEAKIKSKEDTVDNIIDNSEASKIIDPSQLKDLFEHNYVDEIVTETAGRSSCPPPRPTTPEQRTYDDDKITFTTSTGKLHTYKKMWKSKPGRKKRVLDDEDPIEKPPVTDIVVVMPPKNMQIVQYATRPKNPKKARKDGKYKTIKKVDLEKLVGDGEKVSINTQHSHASTKEQAQVSLSEKRLELLEEDMVNAKVRLKAATEMYDKQRKKYKQLQESSNKSKSKKKPKLYTINPFCVPISLLDLSS